MERNETTVCNQISICPDNLAIKGSKTCMTVKSPKMILNVLLYVVVVFSTETSSTPTWWNGNVSNPENTWTSVSCFIPLKVFWDSGVCNSCSAQVKAWVSLLPNLYKENLGSELMQISQTGVGAAFAMRHSLESHGYVSLTNFRAFLSFFTPLHLSFLSLTWCW